LFFGAVVGLGEDYDDTPIEHEPLDELPRKYDFIVVGSGAGGSVVSSNIAKAFPYYTVLVVEGGVEGQRLVGGKDFVATKTKYNRDGVLVRDPIPWTKYDVWVYLQTIYNGDFFLNNTWGIDNFPPAWHQHKVIGGNMACNGMAWQLPSKASFDMWNLTGWMGDDLWPFYMALENYTGLPEAGNPNYGLDGPIKVSEPTVNSLLTTKFNEVVAAQGFPFLGDFNNGTAGVGFYTQNYNTRNGVRDSSSVALLAKTLKSQRNIRLAAGCTVTVVLFDYENNAEGVECVDFLGDTWRFYARKEVILSAGTLQTPKILMNSGIGPNSTLNAFGKPRRVVNEIIGQRIMNQQYYAMTFQDLTIPNPNFYALANTATQFAATGQGNFGTPNGTTLSVLVNASHPVPDVLFLFSQSSTSPTQSLFSQQFGILIGLQFEVYMNATVNLTSSNPLANTTFELNVFVNEEDVNTMVLGVKKLREVMTGWTTATEIFPGPSVNSSADIAASIRANGQIIGHFSGSVPIGDTPDFPLDLELRVRGVNKLRVADASALHAQISRGMQATAAMVGQKASALIIAQYEDDYANNYN